MALVEFLRRSWRRWFPVLPLGLRGERVAARFLKRKGYLILARGDRSPLGELDLVAMDGRTLVFVEVKTRNSAEAGAPWEAVDPDKQRRLTRLAVAWMKRRRVLDAAARFDVVAITWPAARQPPHIEHFPNAFEALDRGGWFS